LAGPRLAVKAIAAGLVDECHLLLGPVLVGGSKRALPANVRSRSNCSTNAASEAASSTFTVKSAADRGLRHARQCSIVAHAAMLTRLPLAAHTGSRS
jgi:riboflavin biosynthesis pyrimidine reductase